MAAWYPSAGHRDGVRWPLVGSGLASQVRGQMSNVYAVLEQIRARPEMYVGLDPEHRRDQLLSLEMMLHGYSLALQLHEIAEPGRDLLPNLGRYIEDKLGWSMSCGPVSAILENAGSDERAWEAWWTLLEEYRLASADA